MSLNKYIRIGSNIKEIRTSKGITQKEMADILNIPYSTYSNYENANRVPDNETLERIASALDINVWRLLLFEKELNFKEIGNRLSCIRKFHSLTQDQLANTISKSRSTVQKYENGCIEIPLSVLQSIAKTLNTTIHYLLGYEDDTNTNTNNFPIGNDLINNKNIRRIYKMKVLGARCIVKEEKLEEKTTGGIVIPGRDKTPTNKGVVVSVGDGAMLDNGTKVPMEVAEGDTIVYASFAGSPIQVENETFIILNERDILCILN